jgi:hypothetical protein
MKLTRMSAQTRGVAVELIVELDGVHCEAVRFGVGDEAADVARRLHQLAERIARRAPASGVAATSIASSETRNKGGA